MILLTQIELLDLEIITIEFCMHNIIMSPLFRSRIGLTQPKLRDECIFTLLKVP